MELESTFIGYIFKEGANLRDIRFYVFQIPNRYPTLSEVREWSGFENLTEEDYNELRTEFYIEKKFFTRIILHQLGCNTIEEYNRKKKSRYSAKQKKARGGREWSRIRKQVLARDNNQCVITGQAKQLFVHHINGDKKDRRLENLVTVSRKVSTSIHHGTRDFHPDDLLYWQQRNPDLVSKSAARLDFLKNYVKWLHANGYPQACIESLPFHVLAGDEWRIGLNKHLHFSSYGRRSYNVNHWVVFLEPTGLSYETRKFEDLYKERYGRSYALRYEFEEQKCVDCPHEGIPPCGDYHYGPYCLVGSNRQEDEED
ncbi:MAG: HNH endonuclease [Candidatus Thorarchaeota archaeon]